MDSIREWMKRETIQANQRRDWNTLPSDYTVRAVQQVYRTIKPHFDKRDIKARIDASRATTFIDLLRAIDHMNYL